MKDSIIENAEAVLADAKEKLRFNSNKLEEAKRSIIRPDNTVRPGAASEVSQRQIEVDALKIRVGDCEKTLSHTIDDLSRRESERKRALELNQQADDVDKKAVELQAQLEKLVSNSNDLRKQADIHHSEASASSQDRARRIEAERIAKEEKRKEEMTTREIHLRSAKFSLEAAEEGRMPIEHIEQRRKAVTLAEEALAAV